MSFRPKKYNFPEALQKLRRYCSYQERCQQEVSQKLYEWGFDREDSGKVIVQLIEEGFLSEERYARAIAGGKFRQKGWGRNKIAASLKSRGIVANLVTSSMKEIDGKEYRKKLETLLEKKALSLKGEQPLALRQKLARYALSKGYEAELVWECINRKWPPAGSFDI